MADSAFHATLKVQNDLYIANQEGGNLHCYQSFERILKRFGKGFSVRMGFGLHVGWCIEGAIGSDKKIDCTYISPHVEMADRLEAGSKIFGSPINASHWFVALLSPEAREMMRISDRLKVTGCPVPMTIYTFDITNYDKNFGKPKINPMTGEQEPVDFKNDPQYKDLQKGLSVEFMVQYRRGVDFYLDGKWHRARECLEDALHLNDTDNPSKQLMKVMAQNSVNADVWEAPESDFECGWVHPILEGY
jgi:hypothetical protein